MKFNFIKNIFIFSTVLTSIFFIFIISTGCPSAVQKDAIFKTTYTGSQVINSSHKIYVFAYNNVTSDQGNSKPNVIKAKDNTIDPISINEAEGIIFPSYIKIFADTSGATGNSTYDATWEGGYGFCIKAFDTYNVTLKDPT